VKVSRFPLSEVAHDLRHRSCFQVILDCTKFRGVLADRYVKDFRFLGIPFSVRVSGFRLPLLSTLVGFRVERRSYLPSA
jgi:hypothetical protein